MLSHSPVGNPEVLGDLFSVVVLDEETEHLELAAGQFVLYRKGSKAKPKALSDSYRKCFDRSLPISLVVDRHSELLRLADESWGLITCQDEYRGFGNALSEFPADRLSA